MVADGDGDEPAQVKWAVFQVSTANPPVWTSTGSFTTVAIPGSNGSFTPSAQMLGIRELVVAAWTTPSRMFPARRRLTRRRHPRPPA